MSTSTTVPSHQTALKEGDLEHLRSFILAFRHFVENNGPVNFFSICNILQKRLPAGELFDLFRKSRARVSEVLRSGKMQIAIGRPGTRSALEADPLAEVESDTVTPAKLLDLWINAIYFHKDQNKKRELEDLIASFGALPEFTFIDTVNAMTNQIGIVRGIIEDAFVEYPALFAPANVVAGKLRPSG
jgi:hypothetical protein